MWMNGSRSRTETPANARTTGKPSPSYPRGPVVTCLTGRSVSPSVAAATRGRVRVSAVMAGMACLLDELQSWTSQWLRLQLYDTSTRAARPAFPYPVVGVRSDGGVQRSQTAPSGGTRRVVEAGWPCQDS